MLESFLQVTLGDLVAAVPALLCLTFVGFQIVSKKRKLIIDEFSFGGFNLRTVPGFKEMSAWRVYQSVTVAIRTPKEFESIRAEFDRMDDNLLIHAAFQIISEAYENKFSTVLTIDHVAQNSAIDPMTRKIVVAYINVYEMMLRSAVDSMKKEERWEYFGKSISLCQRIDADYHLSSSDTAKKYDSLFSLGRENFSIDKIIETRAGVSKARI